MVVYGVLLGIIALQVVGIARSVRTIRRWREAPLRRPTGALRIGLRLGPPVLVSWSWALIVLVGLPRIISAPLPTVLMGLPDLGYPLVASAVLAFGWGLALRALRPRPSALFDHAEATLTPEPYGPPTRRGVDPATHSVAASTSGPPTNAKGIDSGDPARRAHYLRSRLECARLERRSGTMFDPLRWTEVNALNAELSHQPLTRLRHTRMLFSGQRGGYPWGAVCAPLPLA